ncbi:hypothetical protein IFM89_015359 [Coptis chinensis]|uniref:CCHC-type domain-containing protein n=1 Tax=Coptis chinensis TaxID=261450 RepID=A0A835ICZ0_9MAGN|nr:hypothetical protein IFM89_015359 [Coptis chinensis]
MDLVSSVFLKTYGAGSLERFRKRLDLAVAGEATGPSKARTEEKDIKELALDIVHRSCGALENKNEVEQQQSLKGKGVKEGEVGNQEMIQKLQQDVEYYGKEQRSRDIEDEERDGKSTTNSSEKRGLENNSGECTVDGSPLFYGFEAVVSPVPIEVPTQKPNPVPTQKPKPVLTQKPKPVPTQKPNPVPTQKPKPVPTQKQKPMTPIRKSNRLNILKTKPLVGPNGEPLVFDISDDEEISEPQARVEVTENVVEGHNGVQPSGNDVHLSQLDPVDDGFCTQNINEFLEELNEPDGTHVEVIDVLEELNPNGSHGEVVDMLEDLNHNVFGTWLDVGYDSTEEDSDEEYCPTGSDYSENELDNDIDPMMVDEEVHNLEEELQGTVLGNWFMGTTNIFEIEDMAKVSDPVEASKRYCFKHMYKNFKKNFGGELWENLAWGAAKAYKQQELIKILGVINKTNSKALDWLDTEPRSCWARAHFDWTSKCDELTNNFSESFNSWILRIRDKPLVHFMDKYNLNLLQMVYDRRELALSLMPGEVVPNVLFMIKKRELRYNWPKKQRIRSEDEPLKTHRKCAKCGTPGHNTLTCDARKKGVHGKRGKGKGQGGQDHTEPASEQQPPKQHVPPEEANRRGRKRKSAPLQQEQQVEHESPQRLQRLEGGVRARSTRPRGGRAPAAEVEPKAAAAPEGGVRARSTRPRGGRAPAAEVQQEATTTAAPPQDEESRGGSRRPRGPTPGIGVRTRGLYRLMFGDDNVPTPSTPPMNLSQRAVEPLSQT